MLPSYKESAVRSLMGEFVKLVSIQTQKIMFDEIGMVALDPDLVSPICFSTGQVIDIARLLEDIYKTGEKCEGDLRAVYELAAAAEQRESDGPDHLLHTMMYVMNKCKDGDFGQLDAEMDSEGDAITVRLEDRDLHEPVLDRLTNIPVTKGRLTAYYRIRSFTTCYREDDGDWHLTFRAVRLSDNCEVELPGDALTPSCKKEIADYVKEKARQCDGH